jgi:preprotein translocase subunit SecA
LIREAIAADDVEISVTGDIEDIEVELGLRTHRTTAPPRYFMHPAAFLSGPPEGISRFTEEPQHHGRDHEGGKRKVGRNELCPCGSGKKYKRCCGAR